MSAKEGTPGDWPAQIANWHHSITKPREAGTTVYVYGDSAATVLFPDDDGAIVREHDDAGETWFEWRDLWHTPTGPLRFGISREWPNHPGSAGWYVYGTRLDESGDPCWGHFDTWSEAMEYAHRELRHARMREFA